MKILRYLSIGVLIGAVAAIALVFGVFRVGNDDSPVLATTTLDQSTASEGLQVHGHWTIEVREADGTVVSQREFDNALVHGQFALARILGREKTAGNWRVHLADNSQLSAVNPCPPTQGLFINTAKSLACIAEPNDSATSPEITKTLTISVPKDPNIDPTGATVLLEGTAAAAVNGDITTVETLLNLCQATENAVDCASNDTFDQSWKVTAAGLSPSVPVQAGQQIIVTVELSFS